jgi:TctA family transporter
LIFFTRPISGALMGFLLVFILIQVIMALQKIRSKYKI